MVHTGGNLACAQMRTVNVQLAPGFVVQQPQEVPSLERCEERATVIEAEIAPGTTPISNTSTEIVPGLPPPGGLQP